jgi:FAD/FMN-containing dehydrogenase
MHPSMPTTDQERIEMTVTTSADVQRPEPELPPLVFPDSSDYDLARLAWNLQADQRPAAICTASSVEDVQAAVAYARQRGLRVAAQATGHMAAALPALDDTLLLKLRLHDGEVVVDPEARVARVKAGALWEDVVNAVAPHGLAAMHGSSPDVSVIGYLLGGGLSFYGRAHGMAANHVRAFECVTPDGRVRRVDAGLEPELFYALRGGGGGYAIVTAVEIGLLPYAEVTAGALFFGAADAPRLLPVWRDWTSRASNQITTTFRLLCLPPLPEVPEPLRAVPTVCVDGLALEADEAQTLDQQLRGAGTPIFGGFGPMPSAGAVRIHGDPEHPVPAVTDGMLLERLDDAAIEAFLNVAGPGSPLLGAELRHLGGALAASPPGAGARGHLEGEFLLFGVGIPGAPAAPGDLEAFLDRYMDAMRPWATGTRFASFAERTSSLEECLPGEALERVSGTRAAVDPDGMLVGPQLPPS